MKHTYLKPIGLVLLVFCLSLSAGACLGQNLIPNPSFEKADSPASRGPSGWGVELWPTQRVRGAYADIGHDGTHSVMLSCEADRGAAGQWIQKVHLKPFSKYRFTGWIKTENISGNGAGGANFVLHGANYDHKPAITGAQDWTRVEITFDTGYSDGVRVACYFGDGGEVTGKAWYDDLSMELISREARKPAVTLDATKTREPMSDLIYGQFIEHLGRCIYGGIWAEMLEDRKFLNDVGQRRSLWSPIGGDDAVVMDTAKAYVNGHTPAITVQNDGPRGLSQSRLALIKGKKYTGRIVLAGDQTAGPVSVSLVWGDLPVDRDTVTIKMLSSDYRKYALRFLVGGSTDNGRLEITANGKGTFRVGAVSLMPADNVNGFRADTLQCLKALNSPVYRWPGGNFVSGYNWKDGIGDPDKRPTRGNPAWGGIEPNDVGIHEFLDLCRLLGAQPYIAVNTGLGDSKSAAEEVQYANGAKTTPMGKLRTENGHPEPWKVKWWGVGNEMFGGWQLGHMPVSEYVKKHNEVAKSLWAMDPSIKLVASGVVGQWDEAMFANCADYMNYMSEHFYKQDWHPGGLLTHARQIPDTIRDVANTHREYRKKIPALKGKDIRIVMDEWNYWYGPTPFGQLGTRYFMRDGLGIAAGIQEFSRQSDIYAMANYAQTVNVIGCIKTTKTTAALETTGLALKLYRDHFGSIPIALTGSAEPLDVAAAWTKDRKKLTIAVVNATHDPYKLDLTTLNVRLPKSATLWYMANDDDMAYNDPGKEPVVKIEKKALAQVGRQLDILPVSACIFVFDVK